MNHLKSMLSTVVLSLALSISAFAGDIQSPGATGNTGQNQPPPATCSNCDEYDSTEIQSTSTDVTLSAETQSLENSEFAVDLLLALLSFF